MIYLASPYRHPNPEVMARRARLAALATARIIAETGQPVFSPIVQATALLRMTTGIIPKDFNWVSWDLQMLERATELRILLIDPDGFFQSQGVQAERRFALEHGMPVTYARPEEPCRTIPADQILDNLDWIRYEARMKGIS